jgi:ABC-2 type transport system ATP-binding protein
MNASGSAPPLLRLAGLTRRFGELLAVDRLDFAVHEGELFGLVGPDGAGKTTTLRMLAGVLRPTAGEAWLGEIPIATRPEAAKRRLAYMSQRFGLYTDLTVAENLRFYADLYEVPRGELAARLERLYAFSGLGPFAARLAGQLSGGMRQKLGLSCALVHEPELLLLDEPTFGVDPVSRRELWRILHERVAEGVTAVVSTSYLDEAERFDRVALLHHGRLLALDTPQALQATLDGAVLEVRAADPRRAREALAASDVVRGAALYGDRLHLLVAPPAERALPAVAAALAEQGLAGAAVEAVPPTLEDVFIALVENEPAAPRTPAPV